MAELTPKQEAFALAYIELGNASEAYRKAYNAKNMKPDSVNRKAKELLDNGKIAARINNLRADHVERHKITVDDLIRELEEARMAAYQQEKPQAGAMVAATMGKAKLLGLEITKTELTGKDGKDLMADMPKGVLVVPGVMDEKAWEKMMADQNKEKNDA